MIIVAGLVLIAATSSTQGEMLPVGKMIKPAGKHVSVGSYPVNMALGPGGQYAVVTNIGFREFLTVVRTSDGSVVGQMPANQSGGQGKPKQGLYFGLAFVPNSNTVYASRGAEDKVTGYGLSEAGVLTDLSAPITNPSGNNSLPNHPAGIAFNSDGSRLFVANNETGLETEFKGSLSVIDMATLKETKKISIGGFPFAVAAMTLGPAKDRKVYVASERDGVVDAVDVQAGKLLRSIPTGASPEGLLLDAKQGRLFVANSGSDTISVVNTATDKIIKTVLLRPTEMRGLPGAGPTGIALSPDEKALYVAMGDMNAIGVVDLTKYALTGMIPTGWLPTSVIAFDDHLLVACAKGVKVQNPNGKPVGDWGQYIQNIIEGTVSNVPLPSKNQLRSYTKTVVACNRLRSGLDSANHPTFKDPGIEHVIYIIKENRTYDNVLGDLPQGNGDPSICLFPRRVTPNQHALAERFVLLDNFHVCAEVSMDGWQWSTSGMVSAYSSRNTPYNYSGRGKNYDTEGSNNNVPVDLLGIPDVSRPPSGYIWEHCKKNNVGFRNYGFFNTFVDPNDKRYDKAFAVGDNAPSKKALVGMTDLDFQQYDTSYNDSEAWIKHGFAGFPKQLKSFGKYNAPSRFSEWNREFQQCVRSGKMPAFQMVRFGDDHTVGTREGFGTPEAMVADNDYAVGQLVEAVSKSPFWKSTVICVLEDDAQNGYDHVDAHRSIAFVISPFIKKGTVDHRFYNTDSMLRTMELLLGMGPMSQYDAVADPIAVFGNSTTNVEPYEAILPAKEIVTAENKKGAYRQRDSARISLVLEESDVDEDLNDILWGAIKGAKSPRPKVVRSLGYAARDRN